MRHSYMGKIRLTIVGLMFAAIIAAIPGAALALTPKDTIISNSATASYKDVDNNYYTTNSNAVITTVTGVCGVDLLADDADANPLNGAAVEAVGVPGQTINMGYSIKNTGNENDIWDMSVTGSTYTTRIYYDSNQNGTVDGGEVAFPGGQVSLAMNETKYIVVQVDVPSNAANNDENGFTLHAVETVSGTCLDSTTGHVLVTADANFTITKGVDNIAPSPGNTLTYTINFANSNMQPAKGQDGYRVERTVGGGITVGVEGILVYDSIPSGSTFSTANGNTASGTPAVTPTGYAVYSPDNGTNWYHTAAAAEAIGAINAVGYFLEDVTPTDNILQDVFAKNQTGTFTFTVKVNNPFQELDGCVDNIAHITFGKSTGAAVTTASNATQSCVSVANAASVAVGGLNGYGAFGSVTPGMWATANLAAAWEADGVFSDDNYTNNFPVGTTVSFKHQARNRSAFADILNLSATTANLPVGSTVTFWSADGSTLLTDTNSDGKVDLGTIAGITNVDFIVKVYIPISTPAATLNGAVDAYTDITVSSVNNATKTDNSRDNIDGILAAGVDIANQNAGGDRSINANAPADGSVTTPANATNDDIPVGVMNTVNPGGTAIFPFMVVNSGASSDSFDLSRTGSAPPAGSVVKFYEDLGCAGALGGTEVTNTNLLAATSLTANAVATNTLTVASLGNISVNDTVIVGLNGVKRNVDSLNVGASTITVSGAAITAAAGTKVSESKCYVMTVSTIAGTVAGSTNMRIQSASVNSGATDDIDVELTVNPICSISLVSDQSASLPAGGTTTYNHTLTNNGNSTVTIDITIPNAATTLTYTLIYGGNTFAAGTPYDGGAAKVGFRVVLAAGASISFQVGVMAPAGTAVGTNETTQIYAETANAGGCNSAALDTTDVIQGFLSLVKERDRATAAPHDVITYKVTYKNIGTSTATNVVITDIVPNNTVFRGLGIAADGPAAAVPAAIGTFGYAANTTPGDYTVVNSPTTAAAFTAAAGDDEGEYVAAGTIVRFRVGTGADATNGGSLAPGQEGAFVFQVIVK